MDRRVRVAKLFAKHIKIAEQKEILKRGCEMAVGTPGRVLKLVRFFSFFQ
jgi:superfamily II DNA/RNA helicase